MTTTTFMSSRAPAVFSALSAAMMMTSPPFMSMMPGPVAVLSSIFLNVWNGLSRSNTVSRWPMRMIRWPFPRMVRDQVPGALERGAVHPCRLEPERVELLAEEITNRAHAREIVSAAVDVDRLLEQRERAGVARVHRGHDRALGSGQA